MTSPTSLLGQSLDLLTEVLPPAQIKNQDGSASGFVVDLVKEIQHRIGNKDIIRFVVWENGLDLALKKPNTVLFTTNRTKVRESLFQWVGPVFDTVNGLYTWKTNPLVLNSLEDAKKLPSIGVYSGDLGDQRLTELGFTNLDKAPSDELKVKKFIEGRFSVVTGGSLTFGSSLLPFGKSLQDIRLVLELSRTQGYLAFSKHTDPKIVEKWQSTLNEIRKDGTMERIYSRYNVEQPGPG